MEDWLVACRDQILRKEVCFYNLSNKIHNQQSNEKDLANMTKLIEL